MAIIIRTCPKCGHDLHYVTLDSCPPITRNECFNCGWSSQGELEEVVRVPFEYNGYGVDSIIVGGYVQGNTLEI